MIRSPVQSGLLTGGLVYGLGAVANAAAALALLPVIVMYTTPATFGKVALVEATVAITTVLAVLGTNVGLLAVYSSRDGAGRQRLVGNCLGIGAIAAVITSGALLVLAPVVGKLLLPSLDPIHYVLACAITTLEALTLIVSASYRARGAAWRYVRVYFVQAVVGMGASTALVMLVAPTSVNLLLGRVLGDMIALFSLLPDVLKTPPRLQRSEARTILAVSLPLVPATLASSLIVASPRIALDFSQSAYEVGQYAFATRFASIISLLVVQPFALAWLPVMFQMKTQEETPTKYGAVIELYIVLAVAAGAVVYKSLAAARHWLSSELFSLDLAVLAIAIAANIGVGLLQAVNIGAYLKEKTISQVPPYVSAGVVALPLSLWLAGSYGAIGAATAQLLVYGALAVVLHMSSQRLFRVNVSWMRVVTRVSLVAVAGICSWLVTRGSGGVARGVDLVLFLALLAPLWVGAARACWRHRGAQQWSALGPQ